MTSFKIRVGGYLVTEATPKDKLDSLKKKYPHLEKAIKAQSDGKAK